MRCPPGTTSKGLETCVTQAVTPTGLEDPQLLAVLPQLRKPPVGDQVAAADVELLQLGAGARDGSHASVCQLATPCQVQPLRIRSSAFECAHDSISPEQRAMPRINDLLLGTRPSSCAACASSMVPLMCQIAK